MRNQPRNTLMLFAMTCAMALTANSSVEAGNGWEWQKPLNQRLGAFYTLNKAFKQPKSSSRSYHRSSSYSNYTVTPTYSTSPSQMRTVAPIPSQPMQIRVQPVQVQTPPAVTTLPSGSPQVQTIDAATPERAVPPATSNAVASALALLAAEPVVDSDTPINPTTASTDDTQPTIAPAMSPPAVQKGAVRVGTPASSSTAQPLPFQSTTNTFWQ